MFGFNMKVKAQLESMTQFAKKTSSQVNRLNVELTEARNELIAVRAREKAALAMIDTFADMQTQASFACDFKKMHAFAIERNYHGGKPCTIVGYVKEIVTDRGSETKVCEWYLYCSLERHEELVNEFRESMK